VPFHTLCGTIPGQFHDFQIHFVEQHFGNHAKAVQFAGYTKLPSLPQKLAPTSCREESGSGVVSEENRIARTTENPRASARKKNETLGADRAISVRVPKHIAC